MSAETPQIADAVIAAPQEVGFKVFVGNLSFGTKGKDLKEAFAQAGTIVDAQVITRGARSIGYGFVTFEQEADAIKAVSALDKLELAGRQVNVELAKPPTKTAAGRIPKQAARAAVEQGHTEGEEVAEGEGEGGEEQKRARKPRNKNSRRSAKSRKPRTDAETEEAGDAPVDGAADVTEKLAATNLEENGGEEVAPKPKRRSGRKAAPKLNEDGTPAARKPRVRRGPPTGEPSKTLLFVANLPFSVNDESLRGIFDGFKVASAHVVTKKYGPSEGRSKGFAFVDFENTEEQQKALEQCQHKEVEGREIQLKVAIQEDKQDESAAAESAVKEEDLKEAEASVVAS